MPSTATITAKTGANQQVTALVLNNVTRFNIDNNRRLLQVSFEGSENVYREFDLVGVTTLTVSISGANYTYTVS